MSEERWSIFWCVSVAAQARLMQFQWDNHNSLLEIVEASKDTVIEAVIESPEEIDVLMRQKPRYRKGGPPQ